MFLGWMEKGGQGTYAWPPLFCLCALLRIGAVMAAAPVHWQIIGKRAVWSKIYIFPLCAHIFAL